MDWLALALTLVFGVLHRRRVKRLGALLRERHWEELKSLPGAAQLSTAQPGFLEHWAIGHSPESGRLLILLESLQGADYFHDPELEGLAKRVRSGASISEKPLHALWIYVLCLLLFCAALLYAWMPAAWRAR